MPEKNPCDSCDGKCCRYFALEIDKPTTKRDFDDIRWYLAHEHIRVFVEDGSWYLEVQNCCRHLDASSRCRIYDQRPALCREHSTENCEGQSEAELDREHEFNSDEELARFAARRFRKPKRRKGKKKDKKNEKGGKKGGKNKDKKNHRTPPQTAANPGGKNKDTDSKKKGKNKRDKNKKRKK